MYSAEFKFSKTSLWVQSVYDTFQLLTPADVVSVTLTTQEPRDIGRFDSEDIQVFIPSRLQFVFKSFLISISQKRIVKNIL